MDAVPLNFLEQTFVNPWIAQHQGDTQGDRIVINDRVINAPWKHQGGRVFVSEEPLLHAIGLEFLSSNTPTRQPVQWFSHSAPSIPELAAQVGDDQIRYLDMSDFAQSHQWTVRSQRQTLSIQTPQADILSIRHGRQTWGDRLVIDLDRPTPFQAVAGSGTLSISLDALSPSNIELPPATRTNHLSSIRAQTTGRQTTVSLGISARKRARVWTVSSPPRIIVDIGSENVPEKQIHWLPGLWWRQTLVSVGTQNFPVIYLELSPDENQGLSLKPIWANTSRMEGIAPLASTAKQWGAIAAINGGFFNRNNHLPLGAIRQNGQWYSGPILNRGAIAWNSLGDLHMGRLSLQDTLRLATGQTLPSLHLNSGYVQAGLSRYTPQWGTHYTPLTDFETSVTVINGRVAALQRIEVAGSQSVPIPPDGYLLAARSFQTAVNLLQPGSEIYSRAIANPSSFDAYTNALGAGPLLLNQGRIVLDAASEGFSDAFIRQRAPRSAIAQTRTGSILMVNVLTSPSGTGPTLRETADILLQLNATEALNLDGGNSSALYLGGHLLTPSPQNAARVHNGLGIFIDINRVTNE
ncbi:MAG: phosphodiester glycosidase family protein [Leptolyngbyaceae bacterium]|nr:phosphodiester glycosidase family protein [Leptolyngbyaceae bacterium]